MLYKLKRPIKSPVGVGSTIEAVQMRELTGDDIVEAYASSSAPARQIKAMVVRCSNLLPEEIGKLGARDYLHLVEYVTDQMVDEEDDSPDPKGDDTP